MGCCWMCIVAASGLIDQTHTQIYFLILHPVLLHGSDVRKESCVEIAWEVAFAGLVLLIGLGAFDQSPMVHAIVYVVGNKVGGVCSI